MKSLLKILLVVKGLSESFLHLSGVIREIETKAGKPLNDMTDRELSHALQEIDTRPSRKIMYGD